MQFKSIITKAGKDAIANALSKQTQLKITHMSVGNGEDELSDEWQSLPNEKHKFEVAHTYIDKDNDGVFVVNAILPANIGGFTIKQIGVYDQNGTLFSVANIAHTVKPSPQSGTAKEISINFYIAVSDLEALSISVNDNGTYATQKYVIDNFLTKIKADEIYMPKIKAQQELATKEELRAFKKEYLDACDERIKSWYDMCLPIQNVFDFKVLLNGDILLLGNGVNFSMANASLTAATTHLLLSPKFVIKPFLLPATTNEITKVYDENNTIYAYSTKSLFKLIESTTGDHKWQEITINSSDTLPSPQRYNTKIYTSGGGSRFGDGAISTSNNVYTNFYNELIVYLGSYTATSAEWIFNTKTKKVSKNTVLPRALYKTSGTSSGAEYISFNDDFLLTSKGEVLNLKTNKSYKFDVSFNFANYGIFSIGSNYFVEPGTNNTLNFGIYRINKDMLIKAGVINE